LLSARYGIRIASGAAAGSAPFLIWPRVTNVLDARGRSDLRMRVRITTDKGVLVDEIAVRYVAEIAPTGSRDGDLLRTGSRVNAATVAAYLTQRVQAPAGEAKATCPADGTPAQAASAGETPAQAAPDEVAAARERFWTVWAGAHASKACEEAARVLESDSECTGASCRVPLVLSSGYQKSCRLDAETRIALHRERRRWTDASGTVVSECFKETYRALQDPGAAAHASCDHESKTDAALRAAARQLAARPASTPPPPASGPQ